MKDDLKAKLFYDLQVNDAFHAQTSLEDEYIESMQNKLVNIDPKSNIEFEYARARGALEALLGIKAKRERFIEDYRSRIRNS